MNYYQNCLIGLFLGSIEDSAFLIVLDVNYIDYNKEMAFIWLRDQVNDMEQAECKQWCDLILGGATPSITYNPVPAICL